MLFRSYEGCVGLKTGSTSIAKYCLSAVAKRNDITPVSYTHLLISGFPGETQEDHEELMSFVDEMEFDRLGVFTYSPEEDTPAATRAHVAICF